MTWNVDGARDGRVGRGGRGGGLREPLRVITAVFITPRCFG